MKEVEIFKTYGMYSSKELKEYEEQAKVNLLNNDFVEEEITEEQITQSIYDDIEFSYETEECTLNKELNGRILAIADMGLWYGRRTGYEILGNNLKDILNGIDCDEFRVYADRYNVKAEGYHHDGRNYVEYRELREDRNYDKLLGKLYNNEKVSRQEINYYTKSLRGKIKEIYGT